MRRGYGAPALKRGSMSLIENYSQGTKVSAGGGTAEDRFPEVNEGWEAQRGK